MLFLSNCDLWTINYPGFTTINPDINGLDWIGSGNMDPRVQLWARTRVTKSRQREERSKEWSILKVLLPYFKRPFYSTKRLQLYT